MRPLIAFAFASLALFAPLVAHADDPPQQQQPNQPACNHPAESAYFRQTYASGVGIQLECMRKWSDPSGFARWPDAKVSLTDEEKGFGFAVTGGGCEQVENTPPGRSQCNEPLIIGRPLHDDGWLCRTGDVPGDPSADHKRVQAFLVACRVTSTRHPIDVAAAFTSPLAGDWVGVARRGSSLAKILPFDYQICNLENRASQLALDVWWSLAGFSGQFHQALDPQRCLNADGISSLLIRNVASQKQGLSFTLQRFEPKSFSPCDTKCTTDLVPLAGSPGPTLPAAQAVPFKCTDVSKPGTPASKWVRSCAPTKWPAWGQFRLCYGNDVFQRTDGSTNWPGHYAMLVVNDKNLIGSAPFTYTSDARWDEIIPHTCTDAYDVNNVWIAIGSDSNYDARKVTGLTVMVQPVMPASNVAKH